MALIDVEENKKEIEFPVLRRSKVNGALFIFSSISNGMCLDGNESIIKLGYANAGLISADDYKHWSKETKLIKG